MQSNHRVNDKLSKSVALIILWTELWRYSEPSSIALLKKNGKAHSAIQVVFISAIQNYIKMPQNKYLNQGYVYKYIWTLDEELLTVFSEQFEKVRKRLVKVIVFSLPCNTPHCTAHIQIWGPLFIWWSQ